MVQKRRHSRSIERSGHAASSDRRISSVTSFPTTHHQDAHERELRTQQLLEEAVHADPDRRQRLWDEVVLLNRGAALSIANRYRGRGIDADDLEQVALLGLVKAVHGFKVGEGPGFLAYAVPTISGEVKRHFRDHGWSVRPPRRVQELRGAMAAAEPELTQNLGRTPTRAEAADGPRRRARGDLHGAGRRRLLQRHVAGRTEPVRHPRHARRPHRRRLRRLPSTSNATSCCGRSSRG